MKNKSSYINWNNKLERVPLVLETREGVSSRTAALSEQELCKRNDLVSEIEQFKTELAKWGINMKVLAEHSPTHVRARAEYKEIARLVAAQSEIVHTIRTNTDFPVKKVKYLTKSPQKTIERARIYIIAYIMVHTGNYKYLKEFIDRE